MINIAILGTGKIIPEAVEGLQTSKKFNVNLIFARPHSKDKAEKLAGQFNIPRVSTDLDEVLNDSKINFVYVGLVNSVHHDYAKKFLDAGKNVILEKPFTTNFSEAQDLVDTAAKKNLYLFEAVTNIHMPNFYAFKDAISKIGEIKFIQANYSQYSSRYDNYKLKNVAPAFDPAAYGGALRDLNVYNLNLVTALFGMPKKISYTPNIGWNGVDTSGTVTLEFENFIATCTAAKDSASPCFFIIQGDNGYVQILGQANEFKEFEIAVRGEEVRRCNLNSYSHRMVHEFIEFGETFENGDYKKMSDSLQTSLNVVKIVEQASKNIGD